jgi:hypothetical protein
MISDQRRSGALISDGACRGEGPLTAGEGARQRYKVRA